MRNSTIPAPLPKPSYDSEAMYRAVINKPSAVPGVLKFVAACLLAAWCFAMGADVARSHICSANAGTWSGGVCKPPVIEVKQYHITVDAPTQPRKVGPEGPRL